MNLRTGFFALCLLIHCASPSLAQQRQSTRFVTGEQLFELLNSPEEEQRAAAKFFVLGVVDTVSLLRDPTLCITPETDSVLLTERLQQILRERPEIRRYNAASLVREILSQDFPCT